MGQYEDRLKSLADDELLAGLSSIVLRRNQITAEFLAYLAELDARQLFLDLGFSSLFEYCVEKLGLCESTAGRHIAAARVCRNHPRRAFRGPMCAIWCVAYQCRRGLVPTSGALRRKCPTSGVLRRRCQWRRRGRRRRRNHVDWNPCLRIATACISRQMVSFANCSSGCAGSRGIGSPAAT